MDSEKAREEDEDSSSSSASSPNRSVWKQLVRWVVEQHHGDIHKSLTLDGSEGGGDFKSRGVFATQSICKGETLIRLPASCVLSGTTSIAQEVGTGNTTTSTATNPASPWLRCIAAYYQGRSNDRWKPYMDSLPTNYETIFQWTDDQIIEFLAGTTLGEMASLDRKDDSLKKRYQTAVRPFLQNLGLLVLRNQGDVENSDETSKEEMEGFLEACMCISTRGFHLNPSIDSQGGWIDDYQGPFLLPVIDLLNHDPDRKCTTLRRDSMTGAFYMIADGDINPGQEIFHSYSDTLTAAQILQTFGFVPSRLDAYRSDPIPSVCLTPVVLYKRKHLLAACEDVKSSSFPKDVILIMDSSTNGSDENDVWPVNDIPNRSLTDSDAPDDWLISCDSRPLLSDELLTFIVIQFLPEEAMEEIIGSDGRISSWLDRSILEDVYLGSLVFRALFKALELRKADYVPFRGANESFIGLERDIALLDDLQNSKIHHDDLATLRKIWSLSVRIEEQLSLKALEEEMTGLMESLNVHTALPPPSKRPKVDVTPPSG